jgi:hypothetical protein
MFDNSSIVFPNIRKKSQKSSQVFVIFNLLILLMFNNSLISKESNDTISRMKIEDFKYADAKRYRLINGTPPIETNLHPSTYGWIGLGVGALFIGQHIAQSQTIWKDKAKFRFIEDGVYGLYVDKGGHFVSSYIAASILGEAMFAADMNEEDAKFYGGILGLAYISYIEVMDGFGANFGFSPSDFYFNAGGAGFYLLQSYVPYLENFTPKFQYINAEAHGDKSRIPHDFWVDNYASQSFWISMNVHNMLPENLKEYWLPWLEISIGYTARNLRFAGPNDKYIDMNPDWGNRELGYYGEPRFIIGLDYNLKKLIPESKYNFVNWMIQNLNHYKLPAPAIEFDIKGNARFVFLYPFL